MRGNEEQERKAQGKKQRAFPIHTAGGFVMR